MALGAVRGKERTLKNALFESSSNRAIEQQVKGKVKEK